VLQPRNNRGATATILNASRASLPRRQGARLRDLAARDARGLDRICPLKRKGRRRPSRARERPAARCTRDLMCKCVKENAHEHTGSAEAVRPSLRNGFSGFLRALLGDEFLLVTVVPRIDGGPNPVGPTSPPRDLASTTDAGTTRLRRTQLPRSSCAPVVRSHLRQETPCSTLCAREPPRPPHPTARFVTIASRPSFG